MTYKKIIILGSGNLTYKIANYIKTLGLDVSVLEKKISNYSSLKFLCEKNNIKYLTLCSKDITEFLVDINYNCLIISAINVYIFPSEVINKKNIDIINYHNSLLPEYPGMNVEAWQIYNMERNSGVTWHYVIEKIDKGDILSQEKILLTNKSTSITLLKQQSNLAFSLFESFFTNLISKNIVPFKQKVTDLEKLYYIKDIPNNGFLDISWAEEKMNAFLRAMDYGNMYTLGLPKINIKGDTYTFKKYIITDKNINNDICYDGYVINKPNLNFILLDLQKI